MTEAEAILVQGPMADEPSDLASHRLARWSGYCGALELVMREEFIEEEKEDDETV